MKGLFSIGEVSKIKGVTIKALRYYNKMGILIPKYIDDSTGYRYYSLEQFIYIDVIKGCRALGTSIAELQEIFKYCNTDKLLEFLDEKRIEAQDNIKRMNEIIKNIDILNDSVKYSRVVLENKDIDIKYFKKRYIVVAPCKESGELKELIYYSNLDKIIKENKIDINTDKGIIYNIKEHKSIEPIYVFNEIKGEIDEIKDYSVKVLPEGNYLTLSYNKENEEERISKLIKYAEEYDFRIRSFIEVELFSDVFDINSYSCQIQILLDNNKVFE